MGESMREEDKKKKENIETKNSCDSEIYECEKNINEHKDKLSKEFIEEIEQEISNCKEYIESEDYDSMKESSKKISELRMKIGEEVKKNSTEDKKDDNEEKDNEN